MRIIFPGFLSRSVSKYTKPKEVLKRQPQQGSSVVSALGYGLIGSAIALTSSLEVNEAYGQEKPRAGGVLLLDGAHAGESQKEKLERCKKEQQEKLAILVQYAKDKDLEKLIAGLGKLYKFYADNYGEYISELKETTRFRTQLIDDGKDEYEIIYLKLFEVLEAARTPEEYEAAENAFWELAYAIPWRWHDVQSVPELINVKDHLSEYLKEKSAKADDDIEVAIALANEGRILMKFLKEKNADLEFPVNYIQFLSNQAKRVADASNKSDEDLRRLCTALYTNAHKILQSGYKHMPMQIYKDFPYKAKLYMPLVQAFAILYAAEEKTPQNISNALDRAIRLRGEFNDANARANPKVVDTIDEAVLPLVELSIKATCELPRTSKDRSRLLSQIFSLPCNSYFNQSSPEASKRLFVQPLTQYYFSQADNFGNLEDFKLFLSKIYKDKSGQDTGHSDFNKHTLLSLVDRNHDYFEAGIKALVEDHVKRNGTSDDELIEAFSIFSRLHRLGHNYTGLSVLGSRVRDYAVPNLAGPIFQVFVDRLHQQSVAVSFNERRQERTINASVWRGLNEQFSEMLGYSTLFEDELRDAVTEGLKKEDDPFKRQIYYETLGIVLPNEFQYAGGIGILDRLKLATTAETSCHPVREMGRLIAGSMAIEDESVVYHIETKNIPSSDEEALDGKSIEVIKTPLFQEYETFISRLNKFNSRECTVAEFVQDGDLKATRTQRLLYDLVRLSYGDMKLMKEMMPERRFPGPTVTAKYVIDGKTETVTFTYGLKDENYERYKYLRSNGRFISDEFTYSDENRRDGEMYQRTMHNAFMALAYSAAFSDNKEYKDAIHTFLEEHYGWMYIGVSRWGQRFASMNEMYFNYHDTVGESEPYMKAKLGKLREKFFDGKDAILDPGKGRDYRLLYYDVAKTMMDSAPSGYRRDYIDSLLMLGYYDTDLANIDQVIDLFKD